MSDASAFKILQLLAEYIHLPEYLAVKAKKLVRPAVTFDSDVMKFWDLLLSGVLKEGTVVRLDNVVLTNWFPRVPGLAPSGWLRHSSGHSVADLEQLTSRRFKYAGDSGTAELGPEEKTYVVLSGFGTMRFAPRKEGALLSACDTNSEVAGDASMGIPILLKPQSHDHITNQLAKGVVVSLEGVLSRIPGDVGQLLWKGKNIPPMCLVVGSQMLIHPKQAWNKMLTCYSWTLFERAVNGGTEYSFAFATCDGSKESSVKGSADFLQRYVDKYQGRILTDFDELTPRFDSQVPLGDLMNRNIDQKTLDRMISRHRNQALKEHSRTLLLPLRTRNMPYLISG